MCTSSLTASNFAPNGPVTANVSDCTTKMSSKLTNSSEFSLYLQMQCEYDANVVAVVGDDDMRGPIMWQIEGG